MIPARSPVSARPAFLRRDTALADAFLFPASCPVCGMTLRRGIDACCDACDRRLARLPRPICALCRRYLIPGEFGCSCENDEESLRHVSALGLFDPAWRALVHGLKYSGFRGLARPMARQLSHRLNAPPEIDAVAAVPTDPQKRRERGFGHAELIAEYLAGYIQRPFLPNALGFTRRVADQTRLRGAERKANLKDAFKSLGEPMVQGKSILVVDDVMTTGATMTEAGRALLEAGASNVCGAVICLNLGHVPDGP